MSFIKFSSCVPEPLAFVKEVTEIIKTSSHVVATISGLNPLDFMQEISSIIAVSRKMCAKYFPARQ